jgi:hypothetical protein
MYGERWGASLLMETSFRFLDHNQLSGNGRGQVNEMRDEREDRHKSHRHRRHTRV